MNDPNKKYKLIEFAPLVLFVLVMIGVVVSIMILFPDIFFQDANAQFENLKCHRIEFTDYAYTPFRVYMVHDPAIRQEIIDDHDDPKSRLNFDKFAPEDEKTNLGFYTNSTDHWRIDVNLEYLVEAIDPRETTVTFQAHGRNLMTTTYLDVGFISCFNFIINAKPPPIQLTEQQILELGFTTSKEQIKELADENANLVRAVEKTSERNDFMAIMYSVIFIAVIVGGFLQRRTGRKLKVGMREEIIALNKERNLTKLAREHDKTEKNEFNKNLVKNFEQIVNQIFVISKQLHMDLKKVNWRQAYEGKEIKPAKVIEHIPTEPIDEKTENEGEKVYETGLLGDKPTVKPVEKESKFKIPKVPDILKDIRRKDESEVRDKQYWKDYYRKEIGDDETSELVLDYYKEVQRLYDETPTDELLTQMYALNELAHEQREKGEKK